MKRNLITPMRLSALLAVAALAAGLWAQTDEPRRSRRHTTPITTAATTTQSINETASDTSRINAAFRARSTHYHRDDGAIVYIDTVTGDQWIDSATIVNVPRMKFPLLNGITIGVDIWDPVNRLFGQSYGLVSFSGDVNLHNRYFPAFEIGLGQADYAPDDKDFHYVSPMSVYFKIGANYNFLYNSNPDYKFFAIVRYGFAPFKWGLSSATPAEGYWGETPPFSIANQAATAGWLEFGIGLRLRLWNNISAGWTIKYHALVHQSKSAYGEPWYIPGYGTRSSAIAGSFSISYTIPINKKKIDKIAAESDILPVYEATPDSLPVIMPEPEIEPSLELPSIEDNTIIENGAMGVRRIAPDDNNSRIAPENNQ